MKEVWIEIIKDFIRVRSFITLGAFSLSFWMMGHNKEIPDMLMHIVDLLLGFWFGSKIAKKELVKKTIQPKNGGNGNV